MHHKVKDFSTQFEVFHRLCVADAELDDPQMAFHEIDRVLAAVRPLQAAGLHRDAARHGLRSCRRRPYVPTIQEPASDPEVLAEAVAEAVRRITAARGR